MTNATTTPTGTTTAVPAPSDLAASTRFVTFAITFAVTGCLIYLACLFWNLPLFTFHPATNRIALGWEAARSGEGPAMYWYGWTATTVVVAAIAGIGTAMLPERLLPMVLIWVTPIALAIVVWWEIRDTSSSHLADLRLWVSLVIGIAVAGLGTLLPEHVAKKVPLALVWLLPVICIPFFAYSLMSFWTHP